MGYEEEKYKKGGLKEIVFYADDFEKDKELIHKILTEISSRSQEDNGQLWYLINETKFVEEAKKAGME